MVIDFRDHRFTTFIGKRMFYGLLKTIYPDIATARNMVLDLLTKNIDRTQKGIVMHRNITVSVEHRLEVCNAFLMPYST